MRVICINDDWRDDLRRNGDPVFGGYYEVTSEYIWQGHLIYVLSGCPNPKGYYAPSFAPVSTIDETEFERNYKTEMV